VPCRSGGKSRSCPPRYFAGFKTKAEQITQGAPGEVAWGYFILQSPTERSQVSVTVPPFDVTLKESHRCPHCLRRTGSTGAGKPSRWHTIHPGRDPVLTGCGTRESLAYIFIIVKFPDPAHPDVTPTRVQVPAIVLSLTVPCTVNTLPLGVPD
jgi:hypothetical protein